VAAQVIFPWLSAKIAKGEQTENLSLYKFAIYAGGACSLLPVAVLMASPQLLNVWLGTQFSVENIELELLLVFAYGILAFNVPAHYFLMGLGRVKFLSLVNLTAGLASVLLSLALVPLGLLWFSAAKILFGLLILVNFVELKKASKCQASLNV
jgi:O-antigen/teichoic acid export membrane protein